MFIPKIDEYVTLLLEGFVINNDVVYFDASSDEFIDTSFGKNKKLEPYHSKLPFGKLYAAYNRSDIKSDEYTEVLKAIKGQSSVYTVDATSYDSFLKRTALYMSKFILAEGADTIILMESSSKMLTDLSLKLNQYLPKYYDMFTYNAGIFKNPDLSEITIEWEKYNLTPKTVKSLQADIDRQVKNKYFSIKKFAPQFRKVISNWLKINDSILSKIVDKNVVVIDDIITTGASMYEASELLQEAGANSVLGLCVIKGKH